MGIVGVPVIGRNPIEPGPEVGFHLAREVAREGAQVRQLGGVLGRDDEAEMVPVVLRARGETSVIGAVAVGIEHHGLFTVARDAVALEIREVSIERRRPKGPALVAGDPRLDDDAARRAEKPRAAEGDPSAPEARTAIAGRLAARTAAGADMPRALGGAQDLVDEALGFRHPRRTDAAWPDPEVAVAVAHRRPPAGRTRDSAVNVLEISWKIAGTGTAPDQPAREKPCESNGLCASGDPLLSRRLLVVSVSPQPPPAASFRELATPRRSAFLVMGAPYHRRGSAPGRDNCRPKDAIRPPPCRDQSDRAPWTRSLRSSPRPVPASDGRR